MFIPVIIAALLGVGLWAGLRTQPTIQNFGGNKWKGVTLDQIAANLVALSRVGNPQTIVDAQAGLREMPVDFRTYCIYRAEALGANKQWLQLVKGF